MRLSHSVWMKDVVDCFDSIVRNVSNSIRFQEECDILVLRISRVTTGPVVLSDFRSCMLASLRSLLPKDWDSEHEVAWTWLWRCVEAILMQSLGKPRVWVEALEGAIKKFSDDELFMIRKTVYIRF